MNAFSYERVTDVAQALRCATKPDTMFIAGGTNLLDLMKGCVEHPCHLLDITKIPELKTIEKLSDGGLRVGALVSNSALANDPEVRARYPLLAHALLSGASPQLRNMASVGGNLMQRTRCGYFYDVAFKSCNKRDPGSGCAALTGPNRNFAILGASPQCIATNPSDMSVALAALEATVRVASPFGERTIAFADFHRLPGNNPELDTTLQPGELIISVDLPAPKFTHSHYLKVRDRASYAFALVSVAVALQMEGSTVKCARVALGGVALKPWRALEAEELLNGAVLSEELMQAAASAALKDAEPQRDNRFKIIMVERAIVRAIKNAVGSAT
jgi:xanthine dehydrogenase YagS FAD-binding subunit